MIARHRLPPAKTSLLPAFALCISLLPTICRAQSDSLDQAHIAPRPSSEQLVRAGVEPALSAGVTPFRSNVELVIVPVTVIDALNRPILDLPKQTFTLYEGNVEQQIQYFSCEDAPLSVALVLDYSGSMRNKIEYERQAVQEFFANANPQDEYWVITISSKPKLIASSTQSIGTIEERLTSTKTEGATALYDAIYLGISKFAHEPLSTKGFGHRLRWWRQPQQVYAQGNQARDRGGECVDLRNRHLRRCAVTAVQDHRRTLG